MLRPHGCNSAAAPRRPPPVRILRLARLRDRTGCRRVGSERTRLGCRLRGGAGHHVRRQRALPPDHLAAGASALDAPARPRRHLPAHRRDVYAVRPPRALGRVALDRSPHRLGRRTRGDSPQARVDRRAEMACGCNRDRARLDRGRRPAAALGAHRPRRRSPTRGRRRPLHGRSDRLRQRPARPGPRRLRLPRALSRARDRGGRVPVRGRRSDPLRPRSCGAAAAGPTWSAGRDPSRRAASAQRACPAARTAPARRAPVRRG